jgi:plasmid stabilization system protein ParE
VRAATLQKRSRYRERDPGVAEQFATAVEETLDHIERFPTGTLVPGIEDQRVRRFPLFNFPYHVIFVVLRRGVSVVAIAHDRRRPGYWR